MNTIVGVVVFILAGLFVANVAEAQSWRTSCGADRGSIEKNGGAYVFKTSGNHCTGGIYNQRAELTSSNISVSKRTSVVFSSTISMNTESDEPFILFQVHDGRYECSPPMSLRWTAANTLSFDSDYTMNMGEAGCRENRSVRKASYKGPKLRRDGTAHKLQVALNFDGYGSFGVDVSVDGRGGISGRYDPPTYQKFLRSKRFYMKHGVYSRNVFPYEMRSEGMKISRR